MSTHLLKPGALALDMTMRCGLLGSKASKSDVLGSEGSLDHVDCAGCLRDLIFDMRIKALGYGGDTPENRWLKGGDTGVSSITIWYVMMGKRMPQDREPGVPHDPSDFGRCHRLLELFPAWRGRMSEVADEHYAWTGLVKEWDSLTEMYLEESPTGRAPRLYERLQALQETYS